MHTRAVIRHRIQTEIANDYDNNASVLTARAIQILTDAATTCRNGDYAECIADAVDQIVAAKPSMAGLGNVQPVSSLTVSPGSAPSQRFSRSLTWPTSS